MNFDNLTDEQVRWLEERFLEAYTEGWFDGECTGSQSHMLINLYKESMTKNETCCILTERFQKPAED